MFSTLFGFIQQFTNIFSWAINSLANIFANLNVYATQVYQIISLLPPFLKSSILAIMTVMFLYTLLRLLA